MVITTWVLLVQLWTDPPPKMKFVYIKEYDTHEQCLTEKEKWIDKFPITTCEIKNTEKNKK